VKNSYGFAAEWPLLKLPPPLRPHTADPIHTYIYIYIYYIYIMFPSPPSGSLLKLPPRHTQLILYIYIYICVYILRVHPVSFAAEWPLLKLPPLHVEYAEQGKSYGIRFICSLFCEYNQLEYVRIHVIYRVSQAEYVIHILAVVPQEYVNIYSTRRLPPARPDPHS